MTVPDPNAVALAHRLFDAARQGDAESLRAFVTAGAPANMADAQGNTMLMLAAYHGNAAAVSVLIAAGADVNALNDRGQSPLAGAIFKGEDAVIRVLLEAGADPDVGSPTARQTADMFGRGDLFT